VSKHIKGGFGFMSPSEFVWERIKSGNRETVVEMLGSYLTDVRGSPIMRIGTDSFVRFFIMTLMDELSDPQFDPDKSVYFRVWKESGYPGIDPEEAAKY
jgi:hypothetical protein